MTELLVVELPLPPEPQKLARRLAGCPGAFALLGSTAPCQAYLGAFPVAEVQGWDPEPGLPRAPSMPMAAVPRWLGLLPYEASREIEGRARWQGDPRPPTALSSCRWWRYRAVLVITDKVRVVAEDEGSLERLRAALLREPEVVPVGLGPLHADESAAVHMQRIARILEAISAGEVYQVNLARRFRLTARGSALGLALALFERGRVPFGFGLDCPNGSRIAGVSPELCLALSADGELLTRPIKGTAPRHDCPEQDAAERSRLETDPKERAELAMVIDLERNDLGKVAEIGSVEVICPGRVETFCAVHHRTATLRARLRTGVTREQLLRAFLPSGSVTGAPKIAAMRLIAELESARRGLYTGAYGYLAHDGSLCLAMAIRTLVVEPNGDGEYFAGGGIVADSPPEREVSETLWKSQTLREVGAGQGPPTRQLARDDCVENWAGWPNHCRQRSDAPPKVFGQTR